MAAKPLPVMVTGRVTEPPAAEVTVTVAGTPATLLATRTPPEVAVAGRRELRRRSRVARGGVDRQRAGVRVVERRAAYGVRHGHRLLARRHVTDVGDRDGGGRGPGEVDASFVMAV